ncbi:hypothetical protein [Pleurocapsa sp. FMAR1]|uniref:hypothetical protein n=1 Tax=Pleurocapsa sp. FMAR1 TaxID=3040204 RepID=UPI0029C630B2|nr:hypothetical protein [Pleurocapsa sp. FMAR1]
MFTTTHNPLNKIFSIPTWTMALIVSSSALYPTVGLAQSRPLAAKSAQQETLYLNNDRTYSYNLVAKERGVIDGVVIPAGATIVGKYVPAKGGLRYVAEAVTYDRYSYSISASSPVLEDIKDSRDTSTGAILKDAAVGAAGGTILGEIFGNADAKEIIGGAAAGVAVGNLTADRVVAIDPKVSIVLYDN